ncbi:MAG: DUF99 family protein [Candidatus Bathyarchaeota archaeon]|nr:DUF99 family protein [Candidatus Bathyarchaeota archaeon]
MSSPKPLGTIKPEIRVLGVDDGKFTPHTEGQVLVVGVVFRGGCSIEGVMHTKIALDGLDATEKIAEMIKASPHRRQLRLVMLSGVTFAGFNVVDIQKLHADVGLPVVAVTQNKPDLDDIHRALSHLPNSEERWRIIQAAGEVHAVRNRGAKLYVGLAGLTLTDAQVLLELTSKRGGYPEPLRVAHLIASGITH